MSTTVKTGWLNDKNGDKFAPKTLTSQVQTSDGTLLEDKIRADLEAAKSYADSIVPEIITEVTSEVTDEQIPSAKATRDFLLDHSAYVTPEMYGAAGDGETDDTAAIQAANTSGEPINLLGKIYCVTTTIELDVVMTNGTIIYVGSADIPVVSFRDGGGLKDVNIVINTANYASSVILADYTPYDTQFYVMKWMLSNVNIDNTISTAFVEGSSCVKITYDKFKVITNQNIDGLQFRGYIDIGILIEPILRDESDNPTFNTAAFSNVFLHSANCALKVAPAMQSGAIENAKGFVELSLDKFANQHIDGITKSFMDLHNTTIYGKMVIPWDYYGDNIPEAGTWSKYNSLIMLDYNKFSSDEELDESFKFMWATRNTGESFSSLNHILLDDREDMIPLRDTGLNWGVNNVKFITFKPSENNPYNHTYRGFEFQFNNSIDPTSAKTVQIGVGTSGELYKRIYDANNGKWGDLLRIYSEGAMKITYSGNRPDGVGQGDTCYDLTYEKPIWWNGTEWIYATGEKIGTEILPDAVKVTAQNLTSEQKTQARTNIGAVTTDDISSAVSEHNVSAEAHADIRAAIEDASFVVQMESNSVTNDTPPSDYPTNSISICRVTGTTAGFPHQTVHYGGTVITNTMGTISTIDQTHIDYTDGSTYQEFHLPKLGAAIYRRYALDADTWSEWSYGSDVVLVQDSRAIDDAVTQFPVGTKSKVWITQDGTTAKRPDGINGWLLTDRTDVNGRLFWQTWIPQTQNNPKGNIYFRRWTGVTWEDWTCLGERVGSTNMLGWSTTPKYVGAQVFNTTLGKPVWWNGTAWVEADTDKLDKSGGTMTGTLILANDPTNETEAATKRYVDNQISDTVENHIEYIPSQTLRVGDNILTDDMVTLGAGWSGSLAEGFTHTSGSTEPLTFAVGAADGESYILEGTKPSTALERAILLSLGDSHESDPYDGSATLLWGLTCVGDNGALKITPANGFAGTLSNLTFRKVTEDGENEVTIELGDIQHTDMPNHLSGFWNIAMGEGALESSVNGTRNIAIGRYAERALKTGGRNIGIGTFAMSQMETGENNISLGADSIFQTKKANDCIAIGKAAMAYGAEYSDNIAIGNSAMYGGNGNSTTSKQNIALGNQAGYYGGGTGNVYIGTQAGYKNGNNLNTFIGQQAGKEATGWGCTAIGNQATTNTHSQSTAIGYGASTTKSKQVVIGADSNIETVLKGDLIVRGTDGVMRQIVFNEDGLATWLEDGAEVDIHYLSKSGGTMTGALTLAADPTDAMEAATKQYVDNNAGLKDSGWTAGSYLGADSEGTVTEKTSVDIGNEIVNLHVWEKWDGKPGTATLGEELAGFVVASSGTGGKQATISYSDTVTAIDGETRLSNPSDTISVLPNEDGINYIKSLAGKYIKYTSTMNNSTSTYIYYVSNDVSASVGTSYGVTSMFATGIYKIDRVSGMINYLTSSTQDTYPTDAADDNGYWYVRGNKLGALAMLTSAEEAIL